MVYRQRKRGLGKTNRRGKYAKRSFNIRKPRSGLRQPVHYFKRTVVQEGAIVVDPTADAVGVIRFFLNELPNHTEFTSLYDQYMISGVNVKIVPRWNYVSNTTANVNWNGQLYSCLDYDDAVLPANLNTILQYQNVHMTRLTSVHKRFIKPKFNMLGANTGGVAPVAPIITRPVRGFIDCTWDETQHNCIKFCIPQFATGVDIPVVKFDVIKTYYLKMKNVR